MEGAVSWSHACDAAPNGGSKVGVILSRGVMSAMLPDGGSKAEGVQSCALPCVHHEVPLDALMECCK